MASERRPMRIRLPHTEREPSKTYTMSDPDVVHEVYQDAYDARYYTKRPLTDYELSILLSAVGDYLHLTTYELGQEHCVRQLRDIWRATRDRRAAEREQG